MIRTATSARARMVGIGTVEHIWVTLSTTHLSGPLVAPARFPTMWASLLSLNCEASVKGSSAYIKYFYPSNRSGFDTDFMVNNDEETGLISYIGKIKDIPIRNINPMFRKEIHQNPVRPESLPMEYFCGKQPKNISCLIFRRFNYGYRYVINSTSSWLQEIVTPSWCS